MPRARLKDSEMLIDVREGKEGDIDAVARIEASSIAHPWVREELEKCVRDAEKTLLVAEDKDTKEVLGYITASSVLDECEIGNIAVDEAYRGRKIGNAILNALLAKARDQGIVTVFLEVRHDNERALALYGSAGFAGYGRRKDYYGPGQDAVLMKCNLSELTKQD